MGTRNLIAVQKGGKYKVAQYCQWDGYPKYQGIKVLTFARKLESIKFRSEFEDKVESTEIASIGYINGIMKAVPDWNKSNPEFSSDTGAKILPLIMQSPPGLKLQNEISFAKDSLFCEWAYVLDLDNGTFECYKGFNRSPLTEKDRFYFDNYCYDGYYGVRLVDGAKWDLNDLPTDKEFFATFSKCEG